MFKKELEKEYKAKVSRLRKKRLAKKAVEVLSEKPDKKSKRKGGLCEDNLSLKKLS